jgi:hypothetical protein
MSAEHREKISTANTGKTMGRQTEEHRRCGVQGLGGVLHRSAREADTMCACKLHALLLAALPGRGQPCHGIQAGLMCLGVLCCSKLSESMQKQWQGRKGAERLEKFRAQVLPS